MIRRFAQRLRLGEHIAETLYGTVIVTAVLVSVSETDYGAIEIDVAVVVTAFVFALTHAWAFGMEESARESHSFGRASFRRSMSREWSMVRAALPAVLVMLLGGFGVMSVTDAVTLAITVNVALLAFWGFELERAIHGRIPRSILAGAATASLGLALVVLKISVH